MGAVVTGPEHFREAEKELEFAAGAPFGVEADYHNARALAHAQLAHAAAIVDTRADLPTRNHSQWSAVLT